MEKCGQNNLTLLCVLRATILWGDATFTRFMTTANRSHHGTLLFSRTTTSLCHVTGQLKHLNIETESYL